MRPARFSFNFLQQRPAGRLDLAEDDLRDDIVLHAVQLDPNPALESAGQDREKQDSIEFPRKSTVTLPPLPSSIRERVLHPESERRLPFAAAERTLP